MVIIFSDLIISFKIVAMDLLMVIISFRIVAMDLLMVILSFRISYMDLLMVILSFTINFGPQNWIFIFFENLKFQCSSKTQILSHKFQDPSCRKCSYGPHGPLWFSVKIRLDMEKRYQKNEKCEKWLFEITVKMNLLCGGRFSKAALC